MSHLMVHEYCLHGANISAPERMRALPSLLALTAVTLSVTLCCSVPCRGRRVVGRQGYDLISCFEIIHPSDKVI